MRSTRRSLAVLTLIALCVAGCAPAPGGDKPDDPARERAVDFARCMRENGVEAFPDPDASGALTIERIANGSSLDTDSAAFKRALGACKDLEPPGFTGTGRDPEQQELALAFARCMRDNGIADFPDPAPDGPLIDTSRMPGSPGALSIPGFRAAQEACGDIIAGLVSEGAR